MKKTAKKRVSKKDKKTEPVSVPPVQAVPPVQVEPPEVNEEVPEIDSSASEPVPRKRQSHTRESVIALIDSLIESSEDEIGVLRSGEKAKGLGIKTIRSVVKRLKAIRSAAARVMKSRNNPKRANTKASGFLKPVILSDEMAKFGSWDVSELRSRVDVTKYICEYIKTHDLQTPEDRRVIRADAKLAKLLAWDPKSDEKLTYYRMQTQMKHHFTNPE